MKKIIKKSKTIFLPFGRFFDFFFFVASLPEKMIRKCFGGRRSREKEKGVKRVF